MDKQPQATLTGRISASPSTLLHEEILEPQFTYEVQYLLPWYIFTEKVMLLEYNRLGLVSDEARKEIGELLSQVSQETIAADPSANMSDIAFAIERYVESRMTTHAPAWHMDRSRNDFQACAQVMFGREQVFGIAERLVQFSEAVSALAERTASMPMPGYTHYQSAQVISPGFYLSAVNEQILETLKRLLFVYDGIDKCPLGSGAMSGLELKWDQHRMADLLGFAEPQRHALLGVASREWSIRIASELSNFATFLSRFVTDLIFWGSSEYGFIDLPDQMAGISSAMPQKKNFPILERIRGKSSHVSAFLIDFTLGQRNTAFTNLVETSKEAGSHVITMFNTMQTILKLFTAVVENLEFKEERMRTVCEREFFGGFTLANYLALHGGVTYRKAQVISGRYIVRALERGLKPAETDIEMLKDICREHGFEVDFDEEWLRKAYDVEQNLQVKQSIGSTNPKRVLELLEIQEEELSQVRASWKERRTRVEQAMTKVDGLLV
ncbi:MAG: lyase family protein [Tumebacillaceae bacterium]